MRALVVTLERKVERKLNSEHLIERLRKQGFEAESLRATDFTHPNFREVRADPDARMTAGEQACAWSHVRAAERILEVGEPFFVLEDDAYLHYCPSEIPVEGVTEFLSASQWDKKDPNNKFEVLEHGEGRDWVKGLPYGTQCYYMTPLGAEKFLEFAVPIKWPSDIALSQASRNGKLVTWLAHRPVAVQHPIIESFIGQR